MSRTVQRFSPPEHIKLDKLPTLRGKPAAAKWINETLGVQISLNHVVEASNARQIPRTLIRGALYFSTQDLFDWVMGFVEEEQT